MIADDKSNKEGELLVEAAGAGIVAAEIIDGSEETHKEEHKSETESENDSRGVGAGLLAAGLTAAVVAD